MFKKTISVILFSLILTSLPQKTFASKVEVTTTKLSSSYKNDEEKNKRATVLMNRLNEIKNLDKSSLSSEERKELRKELRSIKKELRKEFKGVYLSVSAIIIIILLLILLT